MPHKDKAINTAYKHNWYKSNRERIVTQRKAKEAAYPDKVRDQRLRTKGRGNLQIWNEFFEKQCGVCAICKKPETLIRKGILCRLSVDHNHITGKVRGLLCNNCNRAIGLLQDNPQTLLDAAIYLEKHNA